MFSSYRPFTGVSYGWSRFFFSFFILLFFLFFCHFILYPAPHEGRPMWWVCNSPVNFFPGICYIHFSFLKWLILAHFFHNWAVQCRVNFLYLIKPSSEGKDNVISLFLYFIQFIQKDSHNLDLWTQLPWIFLCCDKEQFPYLCPIKSIL